VDILYPLEGTEMDDNVADDDDDDFCSAKGTTNPRIVLTWLYIKSSE
jgi:hypothetical protein